MRHGLTARTVVTAIEDSEEFDRFSSSVRDDYQPTSAIEHELVARLVSLLWRLRRSTLIETSLFELHGRLAAEHKIECQTDASRSDPEMFYQLLRNPATLVPGQINSNMPDPTHHSSDIPSSPEIHPVRPNPATIFLRLCNLNSLPIERINRYETSLWRQAVQTIFLLENCKKRLTLLESAAPSTNP